MSDVGPTAETPIEILTPRARPSVFPPKWALIVLGLAAVSDLGHFHRDADEQAAYAWLIAVVTVLAGIRLAIWLEGELYGRILGRGFFFQMATVTLALPLAFVGFVSSAISQLVLGGPMVTTAFMLGSMWLMGAAAGTLLVVVFDHLGRGLASRFHERILLTATGLMAVAGTLSVAVLLFVPKGVQMLLEQSDVVQVTLDKEHMGTLADVAGQWEAKRPEWLASFEFPELVAALVAFGTFLLFLPSFLSAASKLAEIAMERVHPMAVALQRVAAGDRQVRVEEGGSIEFQELTRQFNRMVGALDMAERMERAFGAYVSQPVLARIRQQHGEVTLSPTQREATVFFADLRGFTSMSEKLTPEQVLSILNRYYGYVLEVVSNYEGYVDKFIGDAVYVVFNGPIDQPDHVSRGVACAVALQEKVTILNEAGLFPEVGPLQVGIGVASGPVVAGTLGTERSTQFSVVGDTVNLASRLSDHAPAGQVWVSELTHRALPSEAVQTPVEPIQVKGKEELVQPYRVTSVGIDVLTPEEAPVGEESPLLSTARLIRDGLQSLR